MGILSHYLRLYSAAFCWLSFLCYCHFCLLNLFGFNATFLSNLLGCGIWRCQETSLRAPDSFYLEVSLTWHHYRYYSWSSKVRPYEEVAVGCGCSCKGIGRAGTQLSTLLGCPQSFQTEDWCIYEFRWLGLHLFSGYLWSYESGSFTWPQLSSVGDSHISCQSSQCVLFFISFLTE